MRKFRRNETETKPLIRIYRKIMKIMSIAIKLKFSSLRLTCRLRLRTIHLCVLKICAAFVGCF